MLERGRGVSALKRLLYARKAGLIMTVEQYADASATACTVLFEEKYGEGCTHNFFIDVEFKKGFTQWFLDKIAAYKPEAKIIYLEDLGEALGDDDNYFDQVSDAIITKIREG